MQLPLSSSSLCGVLASLLSASAACQVQNTTTQYTYDQVGNVVQVIDPLVHVTKYSYDQLRRQTKVVDAKNGVTEIGYDGQDRISQISDARRLQTSYAVDGLGNLIQQISPDTGRTVLTYDESGNVKTRTDAKGQVTRYRYDELNRVVEVSYSDGTAAIYLYDQGANGLGHLTQIRDVSGSTQYSYDLHGRVVREAREIDGKVYVTGYRYDGAGRLAGLDYPSGRSVDYLRDPIGNINEIRTGKDGNAQVLASAILYTPVGAVQSFIFGNGQRYVRTYDIDGRVSSYTLNGEQQIVSYDAASRITGIAAPQKADTAVSYGYDELNRLTSELRSTSSLAYSYDAVGNRIRSLNGTTITTYGYATDSNRLIQVAGAQTTAILSDANGSIVSDANGSFSYDTRGRLVAAGTSIGRVAYLINAFGERVQKRTPNATTVFHYGMQGKLLAESSGETFLEYVYLNDIPVARLFSISSASGEKDATLYVHVDHLGVPRLLSNAAGTPVWLWNADAFGAQPPQQRLFAGYEFNLRFPGQYFDKETTLNYNYFRDYDSRTGRYIQSDPIGLDGGINTYGYASGQPTLKTDPSGLQACAMTAAGPVCVVVPPVAIPSQTASPDVIPSNQPFWPEWVRNIFASSGSANSSSGSKAGANSDTRNCPDKDLCDKWYDDDVESCHNRYGNGLKGDTFKSMLRGCLRHAQIRRDRCYRGEPDLDPWTDDRSGIPTPGRRRK